MKKNLFVLASAIAVVAVLSSTMIMAQNSSPYWSLGGNSNANSSSKFGTTNLIPLRLFTNNSERVRIDENGRVGIGITSPVNIFSVKSGGSTPAASWLNGLNSPVFAGFGETASSEFLLAGASNTAGSRAVFQGRRSTGTLAVPLEVANNDYITSFLASAYDGSTFQNPALVSFFVDGLPSAGNVPTRISFVTGSNATNRVERLKVGSTGNFTFNNNQLFLQQSNGNVGIGTTTPVSKLEVRNGALTIANTTSTANIVINRANSVSGASNQISFQDNGITKWALGGTNIGSAGADNFSFYNYNLGSNALTISNSGNNVGIGTTSPGGKLHVFNGSAGAVTGDPNAPLIVENSTHSHINIFAPDASETGILFGKPASNVSGGIIYNNSSNPGGLQFRTGGNVTGMVLTDAGNLGVGTTTPGNYKLKVSKRIWALAIENAGSGSIWAFDIHQGGLFLSFNNNTKGTFDPTTGDYDPISDGRLKINIKPMAAMLDKINQLKPSTYQFKNTTDKQEYNGFIAQEVMRIFPSLVTHTVNAERKLDVYTMDYSGFGVLAIKGIQELQSIIEELKEEIATLKDRISKLEAALATITANNNGNISNIITNASLEQNKPNPFNKSTIIRYSIPQGSKGQINIYDQTGKLVKALNANESGHSELSGYNLASGTYTYTLMVNGKRINSRKMVITR